MTEVDALKAIADAISKLALSLAIAGLGINVSLVLIAFRCGKGK